MKRPPGIQLEVGMSWSMRAAGALIVAALVATTTLAAQGPQFGFAAGVAVPTGDFHASAGGQGFNTAWQAMMLVAFKVPGLPVGLRADGTYGAYAANDRLKADLTARLGTPADEKTKLLGANVGLTYPYGSTSRVQPYLVGGVGAYRVTITTTSGGSSADTSETKFAWNLGGGMLYRLRGAALFLEARYVDVTAVSGFPKTTFLPITAGMRLGGP
jgi:opacity protein-like surface antigen